MVDEGAGRSPRDQLLTIRSRRVRQARRLLRRRERAAARLFLADGPKAVEAALGTDGCVQEVFATPAAVREYAELLGGVAVALVDDRAIGALSDSVSPAGVVASCVLPEHPVRDVVRGAGQTLVICADVRDPGNAGTIIRTADATGAGGVVLAGDSVDAYNPKTVRASVGSIFHLPVATDRDPLAVVSRARDHGYVVLAADGAGDRDVFDLWGDRDGLAADARVAWLFGNEARGLPDALTAAADQRVAIPMPGRAESLNLATAAAVCLYARLACSGHRPGIIPPR